MPFYLIILLLGIYHRKMPRNMSICIEIYGPKCSTDYISFYNGRETKLYMFLLEYNLKLIVYEQFGILYDN
jgi:hypothetical protein